MADRIIVEKKSAINVVREGARIETDGVISRVFVDSKVQEGSDCAPILVPLINELEETTSVQIHGVAPCQLPDAFEVVIPPSVGARTEACDHCAILEICAGFPGGRPSENSGPFVPSLREVGIEVNRACLFKCPFCFYKNFYENETKGFVSKEKIVSLIDELVKNKVASVRFFGGDPVLRHDFPEIIEYAKARGLYTIVNTNGLFRDESSRLRILASADSLIISIHGHDERSEELLTGRGDLFKAVLATVRRIAVESPGKVMVASLITTDLLLNRQRYLEMFSRLGVTRWSLNRPVFTPDEVKRYEWLRFSDDDLRGLIGWVAQTRMSSKMNVVVNNVPHCFVKEELRHVIAHNPQVNSLTRLFFDVQGHFKPGPANHIDGPSKEMDLGSDLAQAWLKNPYRKVGSDAPVPPECKSCQAYLQCVGGSRVQALWFSGSLDGRDPLMVGPIKRK